jgi:hypothetical protein
VTLIGGCEGANDSVTMTTAVQPEGGSLDPLVCVANRASF